jgi:RNA polymerase sigma-70 factor (ECF subfamily)
MIVKADIASIYKEHYALLYALAAKILNSHEDREEAIHDVFLKFWDEKEKMASVDSVKSYLCKAVVNRALNMAKRSQMKQRNHNVIYAISSEAYEEVHVEKREKIELVRQEIDKLPTQCREVFRLSRYEELSQQEIADKLNISIKTVKNHVGKALKILHENLSNHDYFTAFIIALIYFLNYFSKE